MTDSIITEKVCTRCYERKPLAEFYKNSKVTGGRLHQCVTCVKAAQKQKYNPEKNHRNKTRYYAENRERLTAYSRAYYQANKEAQLRKQQEKRRADPETHKRRQREAGERWRKANPEKRRVVARNNKAKRRKARGVCTPEAWLAKCEYWGWRCYLCLTPLDSSTLHMEHRIPLSRGGTNFPANLAPSCAPCNLSKQDKTESEFRGQATVSC